MKALTAQSRTFGHLDLYKNKIYKNISFNENTTMRRIYLVDKILRIYGGNKTTLQHKTIREIFSNNLNSYYTCVF